MFNAELNPICHLLALLGAHHIFHVNRIRVKQLHLDNNYVPHPSSVKKGPKANIGKVNFTILNELFQ
jgi:hypothetical protein